MSYLVDIAKLMTTDLAAGNGLGRIDTPVVVARGYVPRFKPSNLTPGQIQVYVSPNTMETKRIDRTTLEASCIVDVGVFFQLSNQELDTFDAAMTTLQQIALYHFDYGLSQPIAAWFSNEPIFWPDRDMLSKQATFFALWMSTFKGAVKSQSALN